MLGIADIPPPGKLIALLSVLAAALAVRLADDRAVTTFRFADSSRREHQIDRAERVLHAVRMVLDATRMKQEAARRGAPPLGRLPDRSLRNSGHLSSPGRGPLAAVHRDLIEPDGAGV